MKKITPTQLRDWRRKAGMTQEALGKLLGLSKIAVTKIENNQRKISEPEQKLLQLLVLGEMPFHTSMIAAQTSQLEFTTEQWDVIQAGVVASERHVRHRGEPPACQVGVLDPQDPVLTPPARRQAGILASDSSSRAYMCTLVSTIGC